MIALFIACFLNQAAHGPYYAFLSLYLETFGYSREAIGLLWGLGVAVEVGLFVLFPRLLLRFGPRQLMLAALALATLRLAADRPFRRQSAVVAVRPDPARTSALACSMPCPSI